jgi:prepilin-type processing-associated H-X9-DG protein
MESGEAEVEGETTTRVRPNRTAQASLVLALLSLPVDVILAGADGLDLVELKPKLALILPGAAVLVALYSLFRVTLRNGRLPRRGWAVWSIAVSVVIYAMMFPCLARYRGHNTGPDAVCLRNVKNLALALQMYLADNDGRFPQSAGWRDRLWEYTRVADVFWCPSAKSQLGLYAYNRSLSSVSSQDVRARENTVAVFESDRGYPSAGGRSLLPAQPRHLGGDNYGFVDGHAAWLNREKAMSEEGGVRWEP